jgi:5-methylcytosine-specific restriction enzyme A
VTLCRLCPKCGAILPASTLRGPCDSCRKTVEREKSRRRRRDQRDIRNARAWQVVRAAVKHRDGDACRVCGGREKLGVHHITPLAEGGAPLDPANLVTLCRLCHEREESKSRFLTSDSPSRPIEHGERIARSPEQAGKTPHIG